MSGLMVRVGNTVVDAKHIRFTSSLRGSELASFVVDKFFRHPDLKSNAEVRITHNGRTVWAGRISEPNDSDTFHCVGYAAFADQVAAVDSLAATTRKPYTAISAAFSRGAVPWLMHAGAISDVAWAPDDKDTSPLSLASLLTGWTTDNGLRWGIDGGGYVVTWTDPVTPKWRIEQPGVTFTQATDSTPTHVLVQYLAGVGDFQITTVELVADAATRREEIMDVTDRGFITEAEAIDIAQKKFAAVGGRLAGLTESLIIGRGSVATMGGVQVDPLAVKPGDMARAHGQPKDSLLTRGLPYLDVIIDGYEFDADTWTATLAPVGGQRRDFVGVLAHATSTPNAGPPRLGNGILPDTDWVVPTLVNSWVNFGAGHQTARYRRLGGVVYVEGLIKDGVIGSTAFTLDSGFRPAATLGFGAVDGTNTANGRMDVFGSGVVQPVTGNNAFYAINCSFVASL